uniref:Uncharacterized protein n=1 Tax=Arundo donax TaxID=35708 RepID=A0A0A9FES8_ARUDO
MRMLYEDILKMSRIFW